MQTVGLALRLSVADDRSFSIDRQESACREVAGRHGWKIREDLVARDEGISASTYAPWERPELGQLLNRLDDLDVLLFWRLDRVIRSVSELHELIKRCQAKNVALVSATEPFDLSTPIGRMVATIIAVVAEMEADAIRERVKDNHAHLRRQGFVTSKAPYWCDTVESPSGRGKVMKINRARAKITLDILDRIKQGETTYSIAADLESRNVERPARVRKNKHGDAPRWTAGAVQSIAQNPALWGAVTHKGELVRGPDGLPLLRPALISRSEYDQLQQAMKPSKAGERKRWRTSGLLSGVIHCGHCGSAMYVSGQKSGGQGYYCGGRQRKVCDQGPWVSLAKLEDYILTQLLERYGSWRLVVPPNVPDMSTESTALKDVEEALQELERDRYERGLYKGEAGSQRFAEMYGRLETKREALTVEIGSANQPADAPDFILGSTVQEAWDQGDDHERRSIVRQFVDLATYRRPDEPMRHPPLTPERVNVAWTADSVEHNDTAGLITNVGALPPH